MRKPVQKSMLQPSLVALTTANGCRNNLGALSMHRARSPVKFLIALKLQMTFCPLYLAMCSSYTRTVRPMRATTTAHLLRVFARCAQLQQPGRR